MNKKAFENIKFKNISLKNRFIFGAAAAGDTNDTNGNIYDSEINRYEMIADGGVSLIETGGMTVSPQGAVSRFNAHLFDDRPIKSLKKLTTAIHEKNAKIAAQIAHCGAFANFEKNKKSIAPSYLGNEPYPYKKPYFPNNYREASDEDLMKTADDFGKAAERAKLAGFDAIVVHAGHDTLPAQFLSPMTNKRSDKWGLTLNNRIRIHLEILKAIRKYTGEDFCVIIKLGIYENYAGGLTFDEGKTTAELLYKAGYDIIEITHGQNGLEWDQTPVRTKINNIEREGYYRNYSKAVHSLGIPTILTGGLRSIEVIDSILINNEASLLGLCRPLIKEPDLINLWQSGYKKKSSCISCNKCDFAIRKKLPLKCYIREKIDTSI